MTNSSLTHVASASCPMHAMVRATLRRDARLVIEAPKRMVVQRAMNDEGVEELRLFYGDKEVSFDEPALFAFGESLAKQTSFRADAATTWGSGYAWDDVAPLLETLIEEEILISAGDDPEIESATMDRRRPSPLPAARAARIRSWDECEAITQELTGRSVEAGYLELIVPIFRIAHPTLDADGRQVGEANVFPRALRVAAQTEWMSCIYSGTRYMSERPMNVTALKAMRTHWDQMMAVLRILRGHYLTRYPEAHNGWTIGHIERLSIFVLAIPTYKIVRTDEQRREVLHPVLSSLFRVTDGLRMTMHQMMFVPIGEPTLPFDTLMTAAQIHDYAERNYSFHSETGVCAGPRHLVKMFLDVLLEGDGEAAPVQSLDQEVAAALADSDAAFDYAMHALRAHAALFRLWPAMARGYEEIARAIEAGAEAEAPGFEAVQERWRAPMTALRTGTYLAKEGWRRERETVYAQIFDGCRQGLGLSTSDATLDARLASVHGDRAPELADRVAMQLASRLGVNPHQQQVAEAITTFALETRRLLCVATASQAQVNAALGRPAPLRAFEAEDANVHTLLQEGARTPLPFLITELRNVLGLSLTIATDRIDVRSATTAASTVCPFHTHSASTPLAESSATCA